MRYPTLIFLSVFLFDLVWASPLLYAEPKKDVLAVKKVTQERLRPGKEARLTCKVYCSQFRLRTGGARLTSARVGVASEELRLDWTVYKGGFNAGAFASFAPLKRGQTLTNNFATAPKAMTSTAADLELMEVLLSKKGDLSIAVEGLEPSLNYRWRLMYKTKAGWERGPTAVCIAPVCPADIIDEKDRTKQEYDKKLKQ